MNTTRQVTVKWTNCNQDEWDEKCNYACNIHLLFNVILLYIERKWLLMRNLATILPLKSKLSGKFERFNAIGGSIEMLKNSWISKFSIKMKIFSESPKEIFSPHHIKPSYVSAILRTSGDFSCFRNWTRLLSSESEGRVISPNNKN